MDSKTLHRGILLSLGGSLWAAAYLIPYKAAAQQVPAHALTFAMLLSAAALNTLPGWRKNRKPCPGSKHISYAVAFVLGVLSVAGNYTMAEALKSLSPAIASVLLRSQVLFVGLAGWVWLGEALSVRFAIGLLVAAAGLTLLKIQPSERIVLDNQGLIWVLLAAASFAMMQVVTRRYIHRIDPISVNAHRLWIAVLLLLIPNLQSGGLLEMDLQSWVLAGLAALFGPFISRIYYMTSLRHIPAALSTLIGMTSPLFAYLLGLVFYRIRPGIFEIAGGMIMLAGISLPVHEMIKKNLESARNEDRK